LARIRIVKNASGQALYSKKKAHEARMQAFEQGLLSFDSLKDEDIFEIQHRHLLQCLEKATERELIEKDIAFNDNLRATPPISPSTSQGLLHADNDAELIEKDIAFNDNLRATPPISPSTSQGLLHADNDAYSHWLRCCNFHIGMLRTYAWNSTANFFAIKSNSDVRDSTGTAEDHKI
uniref:DUF3399 domain-containing protein n=1 Tax=Gongylonema pulchrum TaxID=637853 RepID=A0A183DPD2_9BILA